jgi:cytochrome c peroxidase
MMRGLFWMFYLISSVAQADIMLTKDEIAQTLSFGPWPPSVAVDSSNRVSGDADAIALGKVLFEATELSIDSTMSCSSCHDRDRSYTTPDPKAIGRIVLTRNSPTVENLAGLRWYGWAGKSDSLWAASIHPIIANAEMAHTAESLKIALENSAYAADFEAVFGPFATQEPEEVLVNTAKSLAAFMEKLVTPYTAFDAFRDDLQADDFESAGTYPIAAQRGLKLFLGRGNCAFCHSGPRFSNNEFHDAGVPYFVNDTEVDSGRFGGLQNLLASPYTLDGAWSDDPEKSGAWAVQNVRQSHADFGIFRTPSLRGVAGTSPYMHDGSLVDLEAVVQHYNTIDMERLHTDGEAILRPLNLSDQDAADLVAFLRSLSAAP